MPHDSNADLSAHQQPLTDHATPSDSPSPDDAASTEAGPSESSSTKKTTKKKTTKKTAAKKTSKKTAKKTAKKAATKKTAKKTAKKAAKKTTKKTSKKAASKDSETAADDDASTLNDDVVESLPESEQAEFDHEQEPEPEADESDTDDVEDDAENNDTASPRSRSSKKTTKKPASKKTTKKTSSRSSRESRYGRDSGKIETTGSAAPIESEMIVNYVPGEECRIAIVADGQLDEFYSEPTGSVSRVGNIYVGKVTNVETSIQAAFVDFGLPENGFLHVSDIHPRYFPSGSDTEQVGKKTPRRDRPPIQNCLKKGQEIVVQVLKEGVGTKGPSLTSYLSIPGRYLVMMPDMDSLGVSRKEDDDDKRRAAKKILAQLEVPDGFGFILRTAGFDRTKTELKRDLAYLQRLWSDMEKRRKAGNKPRLLYSESDLLLRSLRDLVGAHITRVIIDDPSALERAARFLKIVSPRSQAKLASYTGARPVFYAFGLEDQVKLINSIEVPLPSGGRLIMEQTEALVAIDVNSGKSRAAKDAETNAYKTNLEAADVICRQLKLRDLGGLVINDLIDMRFAKHRKAVEQRFAENLKRDRAKSTILPISEFGLLEMTRQRMRGSQESLNFSECSTCRGRGLVQRPDSVAAQALRDLADVLQLDKVASAELVVHPKVAGALLSTRRASLTRVELRSGKRVDVRISENAPLDRTAFYAYDANGNDIDLDRVKPKKQSKPEVTAYDPGELPTDDETSFAADLKAEAAAQSTTALAEQLLKKSDVPTDDSLLELSEAEPLLDEDGNINDSLEDDQPKKKRRRRRRGGRGRSRDNDDQSDNNSEDQASDADTESASKAKADSKPAPEAESDTSDTTDAKSDTEDSEDGEPKKKRRRRRRGGRGRNKSADSDDDNQADNDDNPESHSDANSDSDSNTDNDSESAPRKKRSRRRRGSKASDASHNDNHESNSKPAAKPASKSDSVAEPKAAKKTTKKKRRTLYSAGRRKLTAGEIERPQE